MQGGVLYCLSAVIPRDRHYGRSCGHDCFAVAEGLAGGGVSCERGGRRAAAICGGISFWEFPIGRRYLSFIDMDSRQSTPLVYVIKCLGKSTMTSQEISNAKKQKRLTARCWSTRTTRCEVRLWGYDHRLNKIEFIASSQHRPPREHSEKCNNTGTTGGETSRRILFLR